MTNQFSSLGLAIFVLAVAIPAVADEFPVPQMTAPPQDVKPFSYVAAEVPFYPAGRNWGTMGEPVSRMQQPLPPEESMKHFVTPVDFKVELFASEPDIRKPICMTWDERGRLWVAETIDYPNEKRPAGQGHDRIKICEDTDGDGRADKFTVFAEKLSIPTSMAPAFGGIVVHQAPDTVFLKDTDGDDVADVRRVLFTGWSTADTHAGPSNLQYGPANWLWGMQGYAGFDGEIAGARRSFNRGFYRFRLGLDSDGFPRAEEFEFVRSTDNNSWGIGFSEDGLVFGSTANRNPSVFVAIANRYYEFVRGWSTGPLEMISDNHLFQPITDKVRQVDHHGGYTAGAGHALYTARAYPREYWNRTAFVCGPTGHLVGTFVLTRDGADVRTKNRFNLLASDDEWSAPIMAEVGPDGHVWVIDWYNFIVQHNPTPAGYRRGKGNAYETDLRDKRHGRIYRVVPKQGRAQPVPSLLGATPAELVATLQDSNLFWRRHAQRLLVERGELDVVPQLTSLVADRSVDAIGLNVGAMHALWTLDGLGAFDDRDKRAIQAARRGLKHPSAGVRRSATQVLAGSLASAHAIVSAGCHTDADAQVRLAALLAFAEVPPDPTLGQLIAGMSEVPANYRDRWILDAMTSAAARHDRYFLNAVASGPVAAAESLGRISIVSEHLARGEGRPAAFDVVGRLGDAAAPVVEAVIAGFARGWPEDPTLEVSESTDAALIALLQTVSPAARGQLAKLATQWGSRRIRAHASEITGTLLEIVASAEVRDSKRLRAAEQLIVFRGDDDETVERLLDVINPRMAPLFAERLIGTLTSSEASGLGLLLGDRMGRLTPRSHAAAVRVLLARPPSTAALLDAIETGKCALGQLSLDQKQALSAHPDTALAARAAALLDRLGDLPDPNRQAVLASLEPLVRRQGDPIRGKEVYVKQCSKCHTHGGEGTRIGPDLTGMAVHPKLELLIHLIDPSRSVEGNYRVYSVVTTDGRVLTGLMSSETRTAVELFDTEGKQQVILREDIDELTVSPKSLMPEGFERQVTKEELVDLLEFLTQRGKYLPIPLDKAATVVTTRGMFNDRENPRERLVFADWSPKQHSDVPFQLVDPRGDRTANGVMLYSPRGNFPPRMPKTVELPCNAPAKTVHFLSGASGWGYPATQDKSVAMTIRLRYRDGETEEHPLRNAVHFADYSQRNDVPGSEFAFDLGGRQIRYLAIQPTRRQTIETIELVKGPSATAPIVMAITVELP